MEEIRKYMSEEAVNEVIEVFDTAINAKFLAFLPVIISSTFLLLISIFEGMQNSSVLFGILFFICLSPLLIFGIGAFSAGNTLKSLLYSINFLFQTTVNISVAVYKDNKGINDEAFNAMKVGKYSFNNILLPVLKTVAKKRFLGGIILKLTEFILYRGIKTISKIFKNESCEDNNTKNEKDQKCELVVENDNEIKLTKGADKINSITTTSIKSVIILSRILSVVFALAGIVLTVILYVIHSFFKF